VSSLGILERKEREKSEMRKLIVDAAISLFMNDGYNNVSMRKIAEKIEYSPATLYTYFEDKGAIFFEIYNLGFKKFYESQLAVQTIPDPKERLIEHGRAYLKFTLENQEYYDLIFIEHHPSEKIKQFEGWDLSKRSYQLLRTNVQQCMDAGYFQNQNIDVVAFSLWSLVHGVASNYIRKNMEMMNEEEKRFLLDNSLEFLRSIIK
jgi:AcrR family transcriptional regulator